MLHLFDAIIILTTFVLEFVLKGRELELASLLIVLRLWRLVKLVGGESGALVLPVRTNLPCQGVAVGVGEVEESDAKALDETRRELKGMIVALSQAKEENQQLWQRIAALDPHATT